jgi:hypothetical protein
VFLSENPVEKHPSIGNHISVCLLDCTPSRVQDGTVERRGGDVFFSLRCDLSRVLIGRIFRPPKSVLENFSFIADVEMGSFGHLSRCRLLTYNGGDCIFNYLVQRLPCLAGRISRHLG